MADVTPVPMVASIVAGPTTSGFVRNGRTDQYGPDFWRDGVRFESGPCESPDAYPNKVAACLDDNLVSDTFLADADPKDEHSLLIDGPFFPWSAFENIVCNTSDIAKDRHLRLVETRLAQVRSSKFAQEISGGGMSGSLSFQSSAVPLSTTAYSLTVAMQRLLDARVTAEAPGPHIFHIPSVLEPLASALTLSTTEDYRISFDNYVKSYVPTENTADGGIPAIAPTVGSQAWIAVTGPYEYEFESGKADAVKTIDARNKNKMFIQGEDKLWFRFETCNVFLAKVTLFS